MIPFTKAHAYGNDFLYVELTNVTGMALDRLAVDLCARHTGIGADGLVVFERTSQGASMRLFNADGSRAEVSGNGVRALAAILVRDRPAGEVSVVIDTEGGRKVLARVGSPNVRQTFRAAMGPPANLGQVTLTAAGESVAAVTLNIGNPQCVVLGPLPDDDRFARLGAALERHRHFPEGTNVEFASVERPDLVRIRIWERGVGPTLSSGTGSCASMVAAAAFGGAAREGDVIAPGGAQRVEWLEDQVYLTGWAEILFDGRWSMDLRPVP